MSVSSSSPEVLLIPNHCNASRGLAFEREYLTSPPSPVSGSLARTYGEELLYTTIPTKALKYLISDNRANLLVLFHRNYISKALGEDWGVIILIKDLDCQFNLMDDCIE